MKSMYACMSIRRRCEFRSHKSGDEHRHELAAGRPTCYPSSVKPPCALQCVVSRGLASRGRTKKVHCQ
jgi:hypothetical protein